MFYDILEKNNFIVIIYILKYSNVLPSFLIEKEEKNFASLDSSKEVLKLRAGLHWVWNFQFYQLLQSYPPSKL